MDAEYFRLLFDYNSWADERVLSQAALVQRIEYYKASPGLSFGGLHATLVHIFVAELVWLARWEGGLPPERLEDARKADELAVTEIKTFQDLRLMWHEEEDRLAAFLARLRDEDVNKIVIYKTQFGEPNEQPLSQLFTHVVNHGTQFRAEAAVRLTQLGHSPGDLDLIVYIRQLME